MSRLTDAALSSEMMLIYLLYPGLIFYMFGHGVRYSKYECGRFKLPPKILTKDCQIKNERQFVEFLLRNDWIQRQIGIKMPPTNGFFPDIKGEIYDGSGDKIYLEIEFWAENYTKHGHPFKGCDLILSFYRLPETRVIRGIPVWSFYERYTKDEYGVLCLNADIDFDFSKYDENDDNGYVGKYGEGKCLYCGRDITSAATKFCSYWCQRKAVGMKRSTQIVQPKGA